jgi:hypothetical protein
LNASYAPACITTPRRARASSHPHPLARIVVVLVVLAVLVVVANLLARAETPPARARASHPRVAPRANERDDDDDDDDDANDADIADIARVRPARVDRWRAASSPRPRRDADPS